MGEREWRRQNLEWERKRREADTDADKSHRRVVDERRDRMVLRQQQREKDYKQKKQNDTDNKNSQDLTRAVKVSNDVQCFHFNSISRNRERKRKISQAFSGCKIIASCKCIYVCNKDYFGNIGHCTQS
jgi:hypothetical protein